MAQGVLAGLEKPGNVVLDVDGCLTLSGRAIPGAAEALAAMRAGGVRTLIATNNSTKPVARLAELLSEAIGVPFSQDEIATSAMAAVSLLTEADGPVLVLGEDGIHNELEKAGVATTDDGTRARTVVVGLFRGFDYDTLAAASAAVLRGARLIATNDDPTFPSAGFDKPGAGALVAAVERAGQASAEVAGKPHAPMLSVLTHRLAPGPTWMVGDRVETDILFGKHAGWKTILVLTGVTASADDLPSPQQPDVVLDSIAALVPFFDQYRE